MLLHHYKATVLSVHDGDTAHLRIDRGFGLFWEVRCRFAGINAPELATPAGIVSRNWVAERLTGKDIWIGATTLDNYGRPLVTIYEPEPTTVDPKLSVNAAMLALGLAVPDGTLAA